MALTSKELTAIEDQLKGEKILVTKCKAYAQQCTDETLREKLDAIACKHQSHYDKLMGFLN